VERGTAALSITGDQQDYTSQMRQGEQVLDVGCGTGTLAMEVARRVGRAGRVAGVDPGTQQSARARAKAARRHVSIEFQIGVIEQLPFPDQTFDVVFSTLILPASSTEGELRCEKFPLSSYSRKSPLVWGYAHGSNTVGGPVDVWRVGLASPPIGKLDHKPRP
jgi:SAM-dependent methyltransferase